MKNLAKTGYIICLFLILALFCYFRVKPVYFQTVPYTFDQGRDFLKTQEIVIDKQPALLGPTTGIPGVNHGVWWYYFLTIPFFVTNGNPMGFYYFILLLALAQLVLFTVFLKKEFGKIASLVFAALVALGPYFIKTSIFAINSVLAPPALLAFLYFYYKYTVKKDLRILFLVGFSLSMVFEAEVAFGLFLYPSFFLAILILKRLKDFLGTKKRFLYFVSGLLLPIAPRILFELKSGFSQTQLVLKYFNETSVQASKTYSEVFWERFHLLKDFFLQSFPGQIQFLMWSTLCLIIIGIFFSFSNLKKLRKEFFLFTLILFVGLFVLSLLYKTVFWQNYFEGLPYFFVVFSALSVSALLRSQKTVLKIIVYVYVVVLILSLGTTFAQELQNKESPKLEGLREHMEVSKIIYADSKNDELCIKVYTPPIIPHTYRYLFAYFERIGKPKVKEAFINDSCYLILEKDNCKFLPIEVNEMRECKSRQDRWKAIHVPKGSKLLKEIKPNDHVLIEKWRGKELP
ncbi:hypothetical protein A3E69_04035 [Candidatus Roizmanbacteria bacterium RIFCSPHIGHO2_12_FULL_40_130]|nr:MAG: hypothetical protein A2779_01095 [Candidatus Roizmanbacteria bacterium RIFCSPHIGHO2_01_FULL_40_98]OGK28963.1 MAG: hypothetical protein A3C31_01735 [Candidatus Roizmanbacteria bacterium RIFCSPHIGHO2_02_FULL_40_53]OGK37250.1 MAG: hypothetical protein A3E69_04035 [Candidatus Roizmanbacteria bacterium RIFCSPHIGHO2_12_FULL_40_130]